MLAGPFSHCGTGQFGSVIASQHCGIAAALGGEMIEFSDEVLAGDGTLDQATEAFAGVFVDDGHDLDRPPVGGGVKLEIRRPYPVGRIGGDGIGRGGRAVAFTTPPLRHPQSFVAPKSLDLLVIHMPALTAGIVIGGPESAARMVLGVGAQPGPQRRIRVGRCCRCGLMPLGSAVLPGDAAGEPFTDPQHPLEMVYGRPPGFRA